jgi:hypothetical protein
MSQEKLQAFAEAISKSEELQKRFNSIQAEAAKSTAEKLASCLRVPVRLLPLRST